MNFLSELFQNKRKDVKAENPKLEDVKQIFDKLCEITKKETIKITLKPSGDCLITDSKFGGLPYLPKAAKIPTDDEDRQLTFLAQINCEQLPENDIYPPKGIVQFWILNDDILGLNLDKGNSDLTKRVLYYPQIQEYYEEEVIAELYQPYKDDSSFFPLIEGAPLGLHFEKTYEVVGVKDYRFLDDFLALWNEAFPNHQIESLFDEKMPQKIIDFIHEQDESTGHKIGGYAYFTQYDPRNLDGFEDYEILLLQIDSDYSKKLGYEILWGDSGVGNFFIKEENLKALKFERCLYNWDCF